MLKIQFLSEQIIVRRQAGKSGPFEIREQEALLEVGVQRILFLVGLERDQAAYPKGVYTLADSSFEVDRYKRLCLKSFGRLDLNPLPPAQPALAAATQR